MLVTDQHWLNSTSWKNVDFVEELVTKRIAYLSPANKVNNLCQKACTMNVRHRWSNPNVELDLQTKKTIIEECDLFNRSIV